jgi:Fic family protein
LLAVSQKGEWEAWLLFFLEGVHSQAEDAGKRIARLEKLRAQYQDQFAGARSRQTLETLVDYLIGSPITSITLAQEALKIGSYQMIQRNIEKLEKLGIVREVTGNKRNRVYQAVEILKILEDRM